MVKAERGHSRGRASEQYFESPEGTLETRWAHSERLLPLSQFRRPSLRISLRTPRNARNASSELEAGFQPRVEVEGGDDRDGSPSPNIRVKDRRTPFWMTLCNTGTETRKLSLQGINLPPTTIGTLDMSMGFLRSFLPEHYGGGNRATV